VRIEDETLPMTMKAKPTTRVRRDYDRVERRHLYMTLAFGGAIAAGILILVAAVLASWYGEHMAPMFSVNGAAVSKDAFRDAVKVENWKLDYQESILRERSQRGEIDPTDADEQIKVLQQARTSVPQDTLTMMEDGELALQIAKEKSVPLTQEQIDQAVAKIGDQPESRRSYLISVAPATSDGGKSTSADIDAAKKKADELHQKLVDGAKWEDVVNEASPNAASPDGSIGLVTRDSTRVDSQVIDAIFGAASNSFTDVVGAADGSFQIARVTDVYPASTDPNVVQKAKDAGVSESALRNVASYSAVKDSLRGAFIGPILYEATPQRDTDRIGLQVTSGTGDAVHVKHILISPNGSPSGAGSLAADDPAWATAKADADKICADITAGATPAEKAALFDAAVAKSDDTGSSSQGGQLPWLTRDQVVTEFGDAVFADGLTEGQIICPPVKSPYGYHIIEFQTRRPPVDQLIEQLAAEAAKPGVDFRALATKYSETSDAPIGGSMGFIAKFQLPLAEEEAIFQAPVGGVSKILRTTDALYLYKVVAEETRKPVGDQYAAIQKNGYDNWFAPQRAAAKIVSDATPDQVLGTASTTQ
jgi:hypothetical protein